MIIKIAAADQIFLTSILVGALSFQSSFARKCSHRNRNNVWLVRQRLYLYTSEETRAFRESKSITIEKVLRRDP